MAREESKMFRIVNGRELSRLRKLIDCLDDRNLAPGGRLSFPVDIFRNASRVAALQYGENHEQLYSYTREGLDSDCMLSIEAVIEGAECSEDLRTSWVKNERKYREEYGD